MHVQAAKRRSPIVPNRRQKVSGEPEFVAGIKPSRDPTARELWCAGVLAKRLARPAPSQDCMLAAFEEDGWVRAIGDPLPFVEGIAPKRRLKTEIRHLNACQVNPLIRFRGNGDGICWEYVGPS